MGEIHERVWAWLELDWNYFVGVNRSIFFSKKKYRPGWDCEHQIRILKVWITTQQGAHTSARKCGSKFNGVCKLVSVRNLRSPGTYYLQNIWFKKYISKQITRTSRKFLKLSFTSLGKLRDKKKLWKNGAQRGAWTIRARGDIWKIRFMSTFDIWNIRTSDCLYHFFMLKRTKNIYFLIK